jgi:hypothetical protein
MAVATQAFDSFRGIIKTSKNGKLVADVACEDLRYYASSYAGEMVTINGIDRTVIGVGKPFSAAPNKARVYLYLVCPLPAANGFCDHCQSYCYGDCHA